jgi:hypothetical protein
MDPEAYEKLKRERWMEEKRQAAVEFEAKMLREHLLSLSQSFEHRGSEGDNPAEQEDRRLANLTRFFEASLTRAPINTSKLDSKQADHFLRRKTLNDVTSLALQRKSSTLPSFRCSAIARPRTRSLDRKRPTSRSREQSWNMPERPSLTVVTEDATGDPPMHSPLSSPSSTVSDLLVQSGDDTHESATTQCTTVTWSDLSVTKKEGEWDDTDGTATIYHSAHLPSKSEILSGISLSHIDLPDYAKELIDDLDYIHDQIPLIQTSSYRIPSLISPKSASIFLSFQRSQGTLGDSPRFSRHRSLSLDVPSSTPIQKKTNRPKLTSLFTRFTSEKSEKSPSPHRVKRKRSLFSKFTLDGGGCVTPNDLESPTILEDQQRSHLTWAK